MAAGIKGKIHVVLTYPSDEVGNQIIEPMNYYLNSGKLSGECFGEDEYYKVFGEYKHPFTGVDTYSSTKASTPSA